MIEKTFERLWAENRQRLLNEDEEYQRILQSYRKHGFTDWLIFGFAVMCCVQLMEQIGIQSKLLSFVLGTILAVVFFIAYNYFKAIRVSRKTLEEVEEHIKKEYREQLGR